jgi:hypothetical protein
MATIEGNTANVCSICDEPIDSYLFVGVCQDCLFLEQAYRRLEERNPESAKKWLKFQLKHHKHTTGK